MCSPGCRGTNTSSGTLCACMIQAAKVPQVLLLEGAGRSLREQHASIAAAGLTACGAAVGGETDIYAEAFGTDSSICRFLASLSALSGSIWRCTRPGAAAQCPADCAAATFRTTRAERKQLVMFSCGSRSRERAFDKGSVDRQLHQQQQTKQWTSRPHSASCVM